MRDLKGKTAFVTGGASGFGLEFAKIFLKEGMNVALADIEESALAKAVESLRVEAARLMMEDGRHSMDAIAQETGFADRERMRRAFLRVLGQPPQAIRRNAQAA